MSVFYGIVKDHNGDIKVESKPGEGAGFVVVLPLRQAFRNPDEYRK